MSPSGFFFLLISAMSCCAAPQPENGKKCEIPHVENGRIDGYNDPIEPGRSVEYRCKGNYLSHYRDYTGRITCTDNGWNRMPKCFRICYYNYAYFDNAKVDLQDIEYLEGEKVVFQCTYDFLTPDGKNHGTRTCLPNGEFSPAECSKPCQAPDLPNGKFNPIKDEFKNGEYLQYECNKGYTTINGKVGGTALCYSGTWQEKLKCIQIGAPCGPPPVLPFGVTIGFSKPSYNSGESVEYGCSEYFILKGKKIVTCLHGVWEEAPVCLATTCTAPPPVPNSKLSTEIKASYAPGEKVTYMCDPGYSFGRFTTGEAQCENTNWIKVPECKQIGAQCGPPPVVQFGNTISLSKDSYKSGESVEYKCPEYYVLNGNSVVSCINGVWDDAPVCLEPCTARERDMKENNIQLKWTSSRDLYIPHGDVIEFLCEYGYESPLCTEMRSHCKQGRLNYPKCFKRGYCVLDQSAMLTNNIHYKISSVVADGRTIIFQCNEGMIPTYNLEAKCVQTKIHYPKCVTARPS
ncbi:complement factor H-related protein 1-like [Dendropsophus ebraccatus]|uniref:complement factor H-related protein 1-like n=1 Tax=Dendropsophus ebraccatus TaxID=150705 RepID=UPI003831C14C